MDEKASKVAKTICVTYRIVFVLTIGSVYRYRINDPVRIMLYCFLMLLIGILIVSQTYQLIREKRVAAGKPPLTVRSSVLLGLLLSGVPVKSVREGWYGLLLMLFLAAVTGFVSYPSFYS